MTVQSLIDIFKIAPQNVQKEFSIWITEHEKIQSKNIIKTLQKSCNKKLKINDEEIIMYLLQNIFQKK
jgi:hypothetical protein